MTLRSRPAGSAAGKEAGPRTNPNALECMMTPAGCTGQEAGADEDVVPLGAETFRFETGVNSTKDGYCLRNLMSILGRFFDMTSSPSSVILKCALLVDSRSPAFIR